MHPAGIGGRLDVLDGYGGTMHLNGTSRRTLRAAVVLLAVLASFVAGAGIARGQAVANVGGTVIDDSGARLPGVTVTITNKANGATQVLVTGPEGNYRAVALQPAPYEIKMELAGFTTQVRPITLTVGADATLDFTLAVAAVAENVTVSGSAPVVEVSKSQLSSVVLSEQVSALPNLGRNFMELAQLLPGSAPDNSTVQFFNSTKFGGVADQRNGFTTLIDGGDIDDAIWGSTTVNFTQEAVQEFRVLRNQFDAEYGTALSSVVSVVSKSGTNNFSGTGMYFGRNEALAAKNFFAPTKPEFSQKRAGGNFGGPIVQNKTHFFAAYEYNDLVTAKIIALPDTNPFAAQENGVFPSGSTNHMFDTKVDHHFNTNHSLSVRYFYDNQQLQRTQPVSSDSNQIDEFSKTHSVIGDEHWIMSQKMVNSLRLHYYNQNVGNTVYSMQTGIVRPSVTLYKPAYFPQFFPRSKTTIYDTLYYNLPKHDIKFGGNFATANTSFDSHVFENGQFTFTTDAAFNQADPNTWPAYFTIANAGYFTYKSKQIAAFIDDTYRVSNNFRLNLGLRYDLDTNLRDNDFYYGLLSNPAYAGIENWVSPNRGNDYSGIQPRAGFTWDTKGNGNFVLRGGLGKYLDQEPAVVPGVRGEHVPHQRRHHLRSEPAQKLSRRHQGAGWKDSRRVRGAGRRQVAVPDRRRLQVAVGVERYLRLRLADQREHIARDGLHPRLRHRPAREYRPELAAVGSDQRDEPAAGARLFAGVRARELHEELVRCARDAVQDAVEETRHPADFLHAVAQLP